MRLSIYSLAAALALAGATIALPPTQAHAELSKAQYEDDSVTLSLSAERWVESSTARVVVSVNAAVEGAQAGRVRADMLDALNKLAPANTEWRFVTFNRNPDSTGLERWFAQVEARLPETALGGLNDAARAASKPGLQLDISEMDFTPTLVEVEKARAELRREIYAQAVAEQQRLAEIMPGPSWRVATVTFHPETNEPAPPMAKAMMARGEMALQADFAGGAAIGVATKLSLTALLVLAAD